MARFEGPRLPFSVVALLIAATDLASELLYRMVAEGVLLCASNFMLAALDRVQFAPSRSGLGDRCELTPEFLGAKKRVFE